MNDNANAKENKKIICKDHPRRMSRAILFQTELTIVSFRCVRAQGSHDVRASRFAIQRYDWGRDGYNGSSIECLKYAIVPLAANSDTRSKSSKSSKSFKGLQSAVDCGVFWFLTLMAR